MKYCCSVMKATVNSHNSKNYYIIATFLDFITM